MRTPSRFARRFANFRGMTQLAMGLSLGLIPSCRVVHQRDRRAADDGALDHAAGADTGAVCTAVALLRARPRDQRRHVKVSAAPQGFGATDLRGYNIPTTITGTPTIAIVDAYGYTTLESDLAAYRTQYGLPACTIANGCLKIVNQTGQATPLPAQPPANDDWTVETALDVDMASAACPKCKILVVQATDDQGDGLFIANSVVARRSARPSISNSWGGPEQAGQPATAYEAYFNHAGIAMFVSAGDDGYNDAGQGPDYPGTSAYVIAVGGTNLAKDDQRARLDRDRVDERRQRVQPVDPEAGVPDQHRRARSRRRPTSPRSAIRQTGVAVYNAGERWLDVVGGTSASSPLVAAIFAATGNGAQTSGTFVEDNAAKLQRRDQRHERHLHGKRSCAPPASAGTARPATARRTRRALAARTGWPRLGLRLGQRLARQR